MTVILNDVTNPFGEEVDIEKSNTVTTSSLQERQNNNVRKEIKSCGEVLGRSDGWITSQCYCNREQEAVTVNQGLYGEDLVHDSVTDSIIWLIASSGSFQPMVR